jgi:membrane protein required for colicin V production
MALFSTIDIIVVAIVLLMALKGLMNGFIKEFASLIGLVVGVFLASRFSEGIAQLIDTYLLHLEDQSILKLIGFVVILLVLWVGFIVVGTLVEQLKSTFHPSMLSRVLGFVVGGIKYFVVLALIVTAFSSVQFIQDNFKERITKSTLYPTLNQVGSTLLNLPITSPQKTQ